MTDSPAPSTASLLLQWIAAGLLLVVVALAAVQYQEFLPTGATKKPAAKPSATAALNNLCRELKRECVGKGKPSDGLFELCTRGALLCKFKAPTKPKPLLPTSLPPISTVPPAATSGSSFSTPTPLSCASQGSCYGGLPCPAGTLCNYSSYTCYPLACLGGY